MEQVEVLVRGARAQVHGHDPERRDVLRLRPVRRVQAGLHDADQGAAVRRDRQPLHALVRLALEELAWQRAVGGRQSIDRPAAPVEVRDERAVLVGDPEGAVTQDDQPLGVVALEARRQHGAVEVDDLLAGAVVRVDPAVVGLAVERAETDASYQSSLAVVPEHELADGGLEVGHRLDLAPVGGVDVRAAVGEAVEDPVRAGLLRERRAVRTAGQLARRRPSPAAGGRSCRA